MSKRAGDISGSGADHRSIKGGKKPFPLAAASPRREVGCDGDVECWDDLDGLPRFFGTAG